MTSMTGYSFYSDKNTAVSVEIRGFNNRFLEISTFLPPFMNVADSLIREAVGAKCARGKVEVIIKAKQDQRQIEFFVNENVLRSYKKALSTIAKIFEIDESPRAEDLFRLDHVIDYSENICDKETLWKDIEPVLKPAIDAFCATRDAEGEKLEKDIISRLDSLCDSVQQIKTFAKDEDEKLLSHLRDKLKSIIHDTKIDEERIVFEAGLLVTKYTISEELVRLECHLGEFRKTAKIDKAPGKKLDFLCQEINREINTIGSKTVSLEVTKLVVSMKENLENIREQLKNIE